MYDLVTFGECMLRLSTPNFQRIEQTSAFDACVGGAELNVAVASARYGMNTAYVSCLPKNPIGRMMLNKIREHGVDTSHIVHSPFGRAGLYFVEFGAMPRTNAVLYDRKDSAINYIKNGDIDWTKVFSKTKMFHTSGITPALSKSTAEATKEAMKIAHNNNMIVSFDLNYRAKLWSEKEAETAISSMMKFCNILITTEEDTYRVFKIKGKNYEKVAEKLQQKFNFDIVVITIRENISVWRNNWTAIAFSKGEIYSDKVYEVEIVDRIGSGDSFTAGFLYGYKTFNKDINLALKYGNASAALKHSIPGDLNWITISEVKKVVDGGEGLRIKR